MRWVGLFLLCMGAGVFSGCSGETAVKTEERTFEITYIKPPQRFLVSLRDVETNKTRELVHVAQWCGRWKEVKLGDRVTLRQVTYRSKNGQVRQVLENTYSICPDRKGRGS